MPTSLPFREYNREQVLLSKWYQKKNAKIRNIGCPKNYYVRVGDVLPEMVLEKLRKLGINITERTLQRYVKDGLIPMPRRGSAGYNRGRMVDYDENTPEECYASLCLKDGVKTGVRLKKEQVAAVRKAALKTEADPELLRKFIISSIVTIEDDGSEWTVDVSYYTTPLDLDIPGGGEFMAAWLELRARAKVGPLPPGVRVKTIYHIEGGGIKKEFKIDNDGGLAIKQ